MVRHECAEALGSIAKVSFQEYYRIKQIWDRVHLTGRAHGWVASRPGSQYSSYVGLGSIVPAPVPGHPTSICDKGITDVIVYIFTKFGLYISIAIL